MMVSTKQMKQTSESLLYWGLTGLVLFCGLVVYFLFTETVRLFSLPYWTLIILACLAIVVKTEQGGKAKHFLQQAYRELMLITWPNRNVAVSTGLMVVAFIAVSSLLLKLVDSLVSWGVALVLT